MIVQNLSFLVGDMHSLSALVIFDFQVFSSNDN